MIGDIVILWDIPINDYMTSALLDSGLLGFISLFVFDLCVSLYPMRYNYVDVNPNK